MLSSQPKLLLNMAAAVSRKIRPSPRRLQDVLRALRCKGYSGKSGSARKRVEVPWIKGELWAVPSSSHSIPISNIELRQTHILSGSCLIQSLQCRWIRTVVSKLQCFQTVIVIDKQVPPPQLIHPRLRAINGYRTAQWLYSHYGTLQIGRYHSLRQNILC